MSKKMMKRSLALGALMAFVITGSAWAAELVSGDSAINSGSHNVNSDVTINGHKEIMIGIEGNYTSVVGDSQKVSITVADGKTLRVETDTDEGGDLNGVIANTIITGNKDANTSVYLNVTSTSEHAVALGHKSVDSITANYIEINSDGGHAIYSTQSYDTHQLIANEVLLDSNGRTVLTGAGNTTITASKVTIISDRSWENKDNNALTVNGSGSTSINADSLILTGGIELMNTEDADLIIKNVDQTGTPGVMQITGNIDATIGTLSGLSLEGNDSFVKGTINTNEKSPVEFSGNAYWNNTGTSNVAKLTLADGIINQNASENIYIASYSGSGTVNFAENSGKVLVQEATENDSLNLATESMEAEDVVKQIGVGADAKKLKTTVVKAAGVVTGETTWKVNYDEADAEGYYYGVLGEKNEAVNPTNASVSDIHSLGLVAWRAENNDMNKRLGELRDANGEHGAWVRMTRGESEYESVKNQYNAYQMGYDQKAGDWTVGAAVTYTEAETGFANGSGENDHTGFAIYGSKLNNDGSYIDLIAKYAKLDHEYTTSEGIGSGDYDTDGYALSAEYGKRFAQGKGLWIEPQVELTYGKVDNVDFVAENGNVSLEDMDSLVGRVGFRAGKDIKDGNVYVRASYLYDFDGETKATFTDGKDTRYFKNDLGGGWWEVGVGANINLSKATYIYADVEKTFGGEVDTNWQWNLGVRYSF